MIKPIFSLKNLRRAAGDAGVLAGYHDIIRETETNIYVNRDGTTGPWPGSLYVQVRPFFFWWFDCRCLGRLSSQYDA